VAGFLGDAWRLQLSQPPVQATWTEIKPTGMSLTPRGSHTSTYNLLGDQLIYVFGGRNQTAVLDDLWTLDPATNTWTLVQTSTGAAGGPGPRVGHAATVGVTIAYDPAIIIVGGSDSVGDDTVNAYVFDTTKKVWSSYAPASAGAPQPAPAHGLGIWPSAETGAGRARVAVYGG